MTNAYIKRARHPPEVHLTGSRLFLASTLYLLGMILLSWNEMRAVEVNKLITSAIEDIYIISDKGLIDKNNDGKLVYLYGLIEVEEPLTEPEYGLSVPAVILKRRVQMYQWIEKKEETPDLLSSVPFEVYHYDNDWKDKLVDSSKFRIADGHENPTKFPVSSYVYISPNVKLGAFTLSTELKNKFKDFTFITSDERPERHDIKMHAGLYYHTLDVWDPKVGDIRLQFSYAGYTGDPVSIIATQIGNKLGGDRILQLEKGKVSPEEMITNEHNWNMWLIRGYRTCGWICLYLASSLLKAVFYNFALKYKAAYIFLTLDRRISSYTSASSIIMANIICITWLFYKPWIGVVMILTFVTPFVWCSTFGEIKDTNNTYKKI